MLSYKKSYITTETATKIESLLESKSKAAKKELKKLLEDIDVFYIILNEEKAATYLEIIYNSDYDSVLLVTYPEFEKIQSNRSFKRLIQTKITIDLRR